MFGVNQTVNVRYTLPYLASAGIGAIPCPSSVRSPACVGRLPSKTVMSRAALATGTLPSPE